MKKKFTNIVCLRTSLILVGICLLFFGTVSSNMQFGENTSAKKIDPYTPFIIIDKDGYTNIREQPNAKSKIIGKVYKYQLFFSIDGDFCGSGMYATDNWEPIQFDRHPEGYIYKKNILRVNRLPFLKLKGENNFTLSSDSSATIIIANDSIQITMRLQSFNKDNHSGFVYGGNSDVFKENITFGLIKTEIKDIEIVYNGQKTILPKDRVYKYCDITHMGAVIGFDGEIYLTMGGGGDAAWYGVWFSIVEGEIVYETMLTNCW